MAFSKKSYDSGANEYIVYTGESSTYATDGSGDNDQITTAQYKTLPIDVSGKKFQCSMVLTENIASGDAAMKAGLEGSIDGTNWVTVIAAASLLPDLDTTAANGTTITVYADCSSASFPHWRFKQEGANISGGTATNGFTVELQMAVEVSDNMSMVAGDFGGIGVDPS
jgi:hypothetical protein